MIIRSLDGWIRITLIYFAWKRIHARPFDIPIIISLEKSTYEWYEENWKERIEIIAYTYKFQFLSKLPLKNIIIN